MPESILRDYQQRMLESIITEVDERPTGASVIISATGTGKGVVIGRAARAMHTRNNTPAMIVAPTEEIVDQLAGHVREAFGGAGHVGIEQASRTTTNPESIAVVASLKTLENKARRADVLNRLSAQPSAILCDEAHHFATALRRDILQDLGYGLVPTVGFTATFDRSYNAHELSEVFPRVACTYSFLDAIRDGWIADVVPHTIETGISLVNVRSSSGDYNQEQLVKAINTRKRNALAVDVYQHYLAGKDIPFIAFCANVDHAEAMAAAMQQANARVASLTNRNSPAERQGIIAAFREGRLDGITAYGIPLEGLDVQAKAMLWLRPTLYSHIFDQGLGREIRPPTQAVPELNGAADAQERRLILDRYNSNALICEFSDHDPERVDDRAGIAKMIEMRSDFVFDGQDSLSTIARYCQSIISVNPKEFLQIRNSDDLRKHYLSPSNHLMRSTLMSESDRAAALPPILTSDEVTLGGALSWHVMGPGRYATALLEVGPRGDLVRKSAATLTHFGALWVAEQREADNVTVIGSAESFNQTAALVAQYAESRGIRSHHAIVRLGTKDTRELLEAQLLSVGYSQQAVEFATSSDMPGADERAKHLSVSHYLQSTINTEPYIQALQQEQQQRQGPILPRRYLMDRMEAASRRETLGDVKAALEQMERLQQERSTQLERAQSRAQRVIGEGR